MGHLVFRTVFTSLGVVGLLGAQTVRQGAIRLLGKVSSCAVRTQLDPTSLLALPTDRHTSL